MLGGIIDVRGSGTWEEAYFISNNKEVVLTEDSLGAFNESKSLDISNTRVEIAC